MRGTQLTEPSDTSRVNVFGQVLKELREAKGVQQATLAQRLDRSPSLLNLLEKGHRSPTRTIINDLAHVLDLSDEDKLRLLRAGGFPEDEVSVAIQALVSTVSSRTPLDEADQLLLSNDLAHVLSRWKEAFEARKRLREGDAATAEAQLSAMAAAAAHTSALRAFVQVCWADALVQVGKLMRAKKIIEAVVHRLEHRPVAWHLPLQAEALATQGMTALRLGSYITARQDIECSKLQYSGLLYGKHANPAIARQGMGKSNKRLAQIAMFSGDPGAALMYCVDAKAQLKEIKDTISRGRWLRRTQELEGWAYAELGDYEEAIRHHARSLGECKQARDYNGVAKNLIYLGDDRRSQIESTLAAADVHTISEPQRRRSEARSVLEHHREQLLQAERDYREALAACHEIDTCKILLGRCQRGLAIVLRMKGALRDGEDAHLLDEQCYQEAQDLLESALVLERQLSQDRRIPSIYESLAQLTWEWGTHDWRERTVRYYVAALTELSAAQMTSADPAAARLRERADAALAALTALKVTPENTPASAKAERSLEAVIRDAVELTGSRNWQEICAELIQLLTRVVTEDPDAFVGYDHEDAWLEALEEFESKADPHLLAQDRLPSSLSTLLPGGYPPNAVSIHVRRVEAFERSVRELRMADGRRVNHDLCSRRAVEQVLQQDSDTRRLTLAQADNAARHMRGTHPGYLLDSGLYHLPLGFAVKEQTTLAKIPAALASRLFLGAYTGGRAPDPQSYRCYRIAENVQLVHNISGIFDRLVAEARESIKLTGGLDTPTWLSYLDTAEARRPVPVFA